MIVSDLARDWRACRRWSLDDLAARFGTRRVLLGRIRDGRLAVSAEAGVEQSESTLGDYLDALRAGRGDHYLISPVLERIPELMDDVSPPEAWRRARFRTSRLWLGPAGVQTPLHHDLPENLYVQVFGRKRVRLIPRRERRSVYPYGRLSAAPNFSPVDAWRPDLERFPRFRGVRSFDCELEPGECLYIPRLWWHQVESLEAGASLNLWFANGLAALQAAASQAYARVRGLRG